MICYQIIFKDPVDRDCLQYALEMTLQRLRVFRLVVDRDESHFFLRENKQKPVIHFDEGQRRTVCTEENHGYMIRIGYHDKTVNIDFFHGISDGSGSTKLHQTLLYYYISRKYGKPEIVPQGILLADTPEDPQEYADSLLFVGDEPVSPPKGCEYEKAFQIPDNQMASAYVCKLYRLTIDGEAFDTYMRKNGSSRSAMFTMFMNRVISEQNPDHEQPILAALAANARKAYGAEQTLQCCVSTIPIWYDDEIKGLSWSEQLQKGRDMIQAGAVKERILAGAQGLKKFNKALDERFPTLEEKREYAKLVNKQGSGKYTYGISYVGEMDYGPDINPYIEGNYVILAANTIPMLLEISKWNGNYYISYCTHLESDPYVEKLRDLYEQEGIPCTCEQKEDFIEGYADF